MAKQTLSLLLVLVLFVARSHDLQISIFDIDTNAAGYLDLSVRLDKDDILREMYALCEDLENVNHCFESYINTHFSLSFSGEEAVFKLSDIAHSEEFVEIKLVSTEPMDLTRNIEVFNDVLVSSKPNQENIVKVSFYDQSRSFRMNKDRIKTTITY